MSISFKSIKKIGLTAGVIAVLASTGVLNEASYEINNLSYENYHTAIIGSTANFRMELINKDFDKILKNKNFDNEAKQEIAEIKLFIQSAEYIKNLEDKNFYDNEKFFGIIDFVNTIGKNKTKFTEFKEKLNKEGWDLNKQPGIKTEKAELILLNNKKEDEKNIGTFGFFNNKKGLQSYCQERNMSEPITYNIEKASLNIEKIRTKATKKTTKENKFSI